MAFIYISRRYATESMYHLATVQAAMASICRHVSLAHRADHIFGPALVGAAIVDIIQWTRSILVFNHLWTRFASLDDGIRIVQRPRNYLHSAVPELFSAFLRHTLLDYLELEGQQLFLWYLAELLCRRNFSGTSSETTPYVLTES